MRDSDFGAADNTSLNQIDKDEIMDLLKLAWNRYQEAFRGFLEDLSEKNDDVELKELLTKLSGGGREMPNISSDEEDKRDEVMPPEADGGAGEFDEE